MYCKNCGKEIDNNLAQCPYCNTPLTSETMLEDSGSIWWGVLGCCLPIVGLILFLVWKDTKPKSGKKAGIGALISVILAVVLYVLLFILMIGVATSLEYSLLAL